MIEKLVKRYKQFITFGIVGAINTLVDVLAFTICAELIALTPAVSQAVGYCCGVICSFILNHRVTFRDTASGGMIWNQFIRFIAVNAASLIISTLMMRYLTNIGFWLYFAKAVILVATMLINYFGYKFLVFNKRK